MMHVRSAAAHLTRCKKLAQLMNKASPISPRRRGVYMQESFDSANELHGLRRLKLGRSNVSIIHRKVALAVLESFRDVLPP